MTNQQFIPRRGFLCRSLAVSAGVLLAGCQSLPPFSLEEAVRRLLYRSSERAFARLTASDGYWDEAVRGAGLADLLGARGDVLSTILTSALFRSRLEGIFAGIARDASDRAAPAVTNAVRVIGISNALALVNGGPRAATTFLRGGMGTRLVDVLVPQVGEALRLSRDPLVASLLQGVAGIDPGALADDISNRLKDIIWQEIGNEEAAIRADPAATGDPTLITVFGNPLGKSLRRQTVGSGKSSVPI